MRSSLASRHFLLGANIPLSTLFSNTISLWQTNPAPASNHSLPSHCSLRAFLKYQVPVSAGFSALLNENGLVFFLSISIKMPGCYSEADHCHLVPDPYLHTSTVETSLLKSKTLLIRNHDWCNGNRLIIVFPNFLRNPLKLCLHF